MKRMMLIACLVVAASCGGKKNKEHEGGSGSAVAGFDNFCPILTIAVGLDYHRVGIGNEIGVLELRKKLFAQLGLLRRNLFVVQSFIRVVFGCCLGLRLFRLSSLTEARQQEFLLGYEQTLQGAFRDVSDSLVAYRKTQEFRQQQELLVASAEDASRLSHMRYNGGVASYLEVLTNETNYFSAELGLVQAQLNERLTLVQLYRALGGGWEP